MRSALRSRPHKPRATHIFDRALTGRESNGELGTLGRMQLEVDAFSFSAALFGPRQRESIFVALTDFELIQTLAKVQHFFRDLGKK